jgi:hypothetical protein
MTLSLPPGGQGDLYQSPPLGLPPPPPVDTSSRAATSLLLGIFAMLLTPCLCCGCGIVLTIPMAIAGLLLGIQGLQSQNRAAAMAGIVLCSLVLLLSLVAIVMHSAAGLRHNVGGMHW